jgi:transcriptional regulator with XRE-family HTH domain
MTKEYPMNKINLIKITPDWRFKRVYKEQKFTIQELERLTGIPKHHLSSYGLGRYNLDALERRRIAKAIGMPEDEVFERREVHSIK